MSENPELKDLPEWLMLPLHAKVGRKSYTCPQRAAKDAVKINVLVEKKAFYIKPISPDICKKYLGEIVKPDAFQGVHVTWAIYGGLVNAAELAQKIKTTVQPN